MKEHSVPANERLNFYCSKLEAIAKKLDKNSEQIVQMAEAHALPFELLSEVMELSLLIKRHKRFL